ncbi:MAG: hypothetical protein PVF17_02810 [Ignavibacteria bacterium]|jgi:hypothetical protein
MACSIEIQKQVLERLQKLLNTNKELYKNELERISYELKTIEATNKVEQTTSLKSEPSDVTEEGDVTEIVSKQQIWNVDHMNKVLDQLMEKDNIHISDNHKTHLKEVLKKLIDPTLKALPEMSVYLNEKASHNFGEFQVKNGTAGIWLGRKDAEQSYGNEMSISEKFVHELVHGATHFALNYRTQEIAGTINRLTRLHDAAMELLTVEDLMPDTTINEEVERKIAEDRLEYIGKNPEEFFAYAVTHEKVFNKLKDLEVYTEPKRKEGFVNAVMHYLDKVINFALMKWRKEPKTMRGDMLIMKLFHETMQANNTAEREIDKTIVDTASEVIDNLEEKWEELLEKVTDKALKKTLKTRPVNGTDTENTKWVLANLHQLMFNKDHSGLLELVMTSIGLKPEGFVQTQLRNMKESDDHSQRVQDLQMWSGQVERQREGMAQKIGDMITSQFKKKPTNAQRTAIYKTILKDDGALLIEKYGKKVKDFYSDKVLRDKEIVKLDKLLESKSGTKIKLYRARIDDLVNYMQTGKGTLITAKNAFAIASMAGTGAVDLKVSDEITKIIDTLVSLKNIEYNSEGTLDTIVDMLENEFGGIKTTSELQKSLVNNKLEESDINDKLNMKKGYVREVYDDAVTSTVAPLKDKKLMLNKGYTEVVELPMIGTIGDETKMALYVSRDMIRQKINRSVMRYTGDKQEGRSLFENQLKGSGKAGIKQVQLIKSKLNAEVSKDILDILSGKQTKLKSVVTPIYDKKGNIVDYRFNVETEHKMKYLGLETDAIEGVARSYGHEIDVKQSEEVNEAAFNEVVYQMAKDFRGTSIGKSGHEYVMLDENAANPIAREYTKILPKNVKKLMHELKTMEPDENGMISEEMAKEFVGIGWDELSVVEKHNVRLELAKGNVWIRRDMLNDVLGVRDISIINAPLINKLPVQIRTILLKMENFWKQIIQLFKVNIVIKVPQVIIENIISNIMYAVQTGQWPTQIWKTHKEGWDALNIYVDYEKRLNELDALLMKDKSNKKLQIERTRLLDHMKRSPIKPLIDAGLYSHIIEDIDPDAFKSSNRVANWLDNKLEGAPTLVKRGAEWAYVTEKTGLFQLVQGMTAKSDFVARYSQYVFNKDKLIKKEEKRLKRKLSGKEVEKIEQKVLRDVRDTFINYVKPDDPFMQYMNDIGLFLFTKYAIRITRVARNLITKHPIRLSAALLAQETMESTVGYNPSDIIQSSIFTKGVTDWWYSPDIAEVFGQLAMPPLYKDMEAMIKTI